MLCKLLLSLYKDNFKCKLVRISVFDGKICICLYTHTYALLSHFSHVQLFASPWTVACQAPLSMGFFMKEY